MSSKSNIFDKYDWEYMLNEYPLQKYNISEYYRILSPQFPQFLKKYIELPLLQRLSGIGLLCGTDWTKLYKNRFYYSRLDHSVGVALIIWNFTKNKAQTISGLLHDVATPVFSHVGDFRKGDALTQTVTEGPTQSLIKNDKALLAFLSEDGLTAEQVCDYHKYPVADNEIPCLSADRLEYMFPSGMALNGSWSMEEISYVYGDISVLKNEEGIDELGFNSLEAAELYCDKFCMIGHILQLNENKLTLHFLGQIMNLAVEEGLLCEQDFMMLSETEVMKKLSGVGSCRFRMFYNTFVGMQKIEHTDKPLNGNKAGEEYFCVSLKVKQRYINPLVVVRKEDGSKTSKRLYDVSKKARQIIDDFLTYQDTTYGCVKLFNCK